MKKKFRLLTILACVFAFCMTAFIAVNVNEAKAAGESYTLSFKSNERESITKSMAGWFAQSGGANGITQSDDIVTVDFSSAGGTVYCSQTTVTDNTYGIKVEYKTAEAGKTSEFHLYNTYTSWKAIKTNIPVTDEWQTYEGTFTATTDKDRVTLQVNNASYTSIPLQFRNIVISDITKQTVTSGSAIGILPEVPEKEGYDGYWTIDGNKITAETVYNYGADKVAIPAYEVAKQQYKLTFQVVAANLTESLSNWIGESQNQNGLTVENGVLTVDFDSAKAVAYRNGISLTEGKTYNVLFDYKKVSGVGKFHLFHSGSWSLIKDWIASGDEWATYTNTFTAVANDSLIFQNPNGLDGSVVQFRNIIIYEAVTKSYESGAAIGELPEIPEKTGYDGYWTIDGEKITEETTFDYDSNKTAVVVYERNNKFNLSFYAKDYDMAASAESWNRHSVPTIENGVATLTRTDSDGTINYAAGVGKYNVEAGKTYKLELKIKSDNVCVRFTTEKPDYKTIFIDTWVNNSDYMEYSFDYAATTTGAVDFIFQLTKGNGNLYIKDFYFYEDITIVIEGGTAIGELPAIPEKEGYANGRWEIDGEAVSPDTVFDYGEDKAALLVYDKLYKLEYRSENYKIIGDGDWKYNQPEVTEDGAFLLIRDPELDNKVQTNYAPGCKFKTEAGKTYVLNLSIKCDNTYINLGFETFYEAEKPKYDYFYTKWTENADYVDYSIECKATVSGEAWILFTMTGGGGEIYVKNMSLYEKVASKNLLDGAAVGELPALNDIPVKHGFEYCWTIDGAKITAETVFNYGVDKVAVPSVLAIAGDHAMTKVEAVDSTCTEDGVKEYYVCACGKKFADENGYNEIENLDEWKVAEGKIAAKGHTATKVAGKAATCKEVGVKDHYNCSVCGKNFTDETCATEITDLDAWKASDGKIAAKGHTAVKVDGKAATCKEEGFKDYYNCSVCGKNFADEACATEIADLEAWKAGDGKLDLVAHTATKVESVAATCTANGVKEYYHCSVCEKNFKEEACTNEIPDLDAWKNGDGKIAAKGHVAATEWNSDENGHWHNCETCGEKMNETAGVHADVNGDGKCDVCGYDMGKEPSGSESKETPTESPNGSGKESSDGGCFSGINGVVGLTTLAILAAAAVILVKRKEN